MGVSCSTVGDLNSDGVIDVVVGAAGDDDGGSGAAFTVDAADMTGLTTVNVTVTDGGGAAGEHDEGFTIQNLASGTTVTFGGDANGIDLANDANVGVTLNTASTGGELTVVAVECRRPLYPLMRMSPSRTINHMYQSY